jgi:hypothetical protein
VNTKYGYLTKFGGHSLAAGISLPKEQVENFRQALNEMTTEVVSSGVSEYGRLSVTLTDSGARVGMGTAFFDSGVSITVDGDGMDVAFEKGNAVYVYLVHQAELNVVLLKAEA